MKVLGYPYHQFIVLANRPVVVSQFQLVSFGIVFNVHILIAPSLDLVVKRDRREEANRIDVVRVTG